MAAKEAPLTGDAWKFGDAAFKAYNRKDYAAADSLAAHALALRPDVTRLWLLRVYALQNQNRPADALNVAQTALAHCHRDPALTAARDTLRATLAGGHGAGSGAVTPTTQTPAWKFGDAAYKDYAAGHYAEATDHARASLRLQPDNPGLRGLLVYSLERQQRIDEAAREADAALRLSPNDEALQALRDRMHRLLAPTPAKAAWDAYRSGDYAQTAVLAREAIRQAPDVQSYRYLLTGALLSEGEYTQADAAASDALAQDGDDALSLAMRGFARAQLGQTDAARADLNKALKQDWLSDQQMATVKRIAADTLRVNAGAGAATGTGTTTAAITPGTTTAATATTAPTTAAPLSTTTSTTLAARSPAQSAPVVFCTSDPQDVLCNLLPAGSSLAGAGPGYDAATRAYAAFAHRDFNAAVSAANEAVQAAPDNLAYRLLLVNALERAGKRKQARAAFKPVTRLKDVPPDESLDVAYTAQRLGYNRQARNAFASAVDAADAGQIELAPQSRQNVRQAVSDLDRTWGFTGAFGYGTVGVMNSQFAPSLSARRTLQSSQELYWRPPVIGNVNGSVFEVYARMNQALYDGTGGATGLPTNQAVFGARWKPFSQQNFVFAVERFVPIGSDSRTDWLLRGAWSEGEGGSLRVDRSNWQYWQVYAEGDYFIDHPQTLGTFEARYGRAFATAHNLVTMPYLALNAAYDSLLDRHATAGIGPGVAMRLWFREDAHHAPRSFVELNVQYRVRVAGDDRSDGVFAGLYFSY
ncbi:tetratricopeptide (TPR) repeat protein [Paraburkholderia sp. GAS333]|uniref:NfrA family protein n=1 Tax=Paraburkholderia sp. GAS333 TaxID=3156279 RepID=UPI003D230C53